MAVQCEICNESLAKYKCSICYCPYCSLNCWKAHKSGTTCKKTDGNKALEENKNEQIEKKKYFTEDTISDEKLRQLGDSEVLKKILTNKHLQFTLTALDNAANPEESVKQAMKDPEFVEFVDECLKIVEDSNG